MSLKDGAETVIDQCLGVEAREKVLVVNDGNDKEIIKALTGFLEECGPDHRLLEYRGPENHGEEPPDRVAEAMKDADVFIAPTKKSISHTEARIKACEAGSRGVSMPGINREIWNTSLQTDYSKVRELTEKAYRKLSDTDKIMIQTSSGTDLELKVGYLEKDTGIIHEPGEFGNLPAGEAFGCPMEANGTLVIDSLPPAPGSEGAEVEIRSSRVAAVRSESENELEEKFGKVDGARNLAEFGFGTNPAATLIGNVLQDEKVLGTVHMAFGDNSAFVPEDSSRRVRSELHWDTVCMKPTVWFDGEKILDAGDFTGRL